MRFIAQLRLCIFYFGGKANALDFQLSTYLGACVQKHPEKKYYIISKDSGYDYVCDFWKNTNVYVKRIARFSYYSDIV